MATPKRFIAGAVCPRCGEMDKLMMQQTEEGQFRECVACGFEDAQTPDGQPLGELETRVNKRSNEDDHTVKQVVFFKAAADEDDED
ncbi:YheV family putative metal-binding protein [Marinobacter halodurans]|uniref:YheV family putative metal-binding protein n=1 Tax=Marinobacter halodurans TaxID=2528979 RepID=A0ABY1ZL77_9GAMM|nr:YheV family putative zinc ribbon protein [Marinobacter halodurans]TBW56483.1 YheV family putative metal-binding protein [Marinobacter halodurans]